MTKPITIGIISPYLQGSYYGNLLFNITENAKKHGIKVFASRTFQDRNKFDWPLSFDHLDGFIIVNNETVSKSIVNRLMELKKPVIGIGDQSELPYPVVSSNNYQGTYRAVKHLIRLGHRRIAFAGYAIKGTDVFQRYEGYLAALSDHSIPYDPNLFLNVKNNIKEGGVEAAQRIIDLKLPCTAVMVGTDSNAVHMMNRLIKAGYRVPEDIAICGYDNSHLSKTCKPALTTVNQSIADLGEAAVHYLIKLIHGDPDFPSEIYVDNPLVIRQSCGCSDDSSSYGPEPYEIEIDSKDIIDHLQKVIKSTEVIGSNLIKASYDEIKNLSWISSAPLFNWGCLGIWNQKKDGTKELLVTPYYDSKTEDGTPITSVISCSAEAFPPKELIPEHIQNSTDGIITINTIKSETENKDWGVLALFEPVTSVTVHYDSFCFTLLSSALQTETLHEIVRLSEIRYRATSEQLETVIRTTTDGIWDWDLENDCVEFSERFQTIAGNTISAKHNLLRQLLKIIHPDDADSVRQSIKERMHTNIPFKKEIRLRLRGVNYIWVYAIAEAIYNDEGNAIRIIGSIQDISARKKSEEQITYMAYYDSLTGLPNRALFYNRLNHSIEKAKIDKHKFAVLLFDLDRFKIINDSYGHQIGDELLKFVANQMTMNIHQCNTVARFGGDEFIILLPHVEDEFEALSIGKQILASLNTPFQYDNFEFFTTGSLGISLYPNDGEDQDTLIKNADKAMYQAKFLGRNHVRLYEHDLNSISKNKLDMETKLRRALENDEFILHYQPQVDLSTGKIYGMESLIRWDSSEGIVNASEFITMVEDIGLIVPLGQWVLKEACRQNKQWQDLGYTPIVVSVNISPLQFNQADFLMSVKEVLLETGLEPRWLCLEITERSAIDNIEFSVNMLEGIRDLGVSISMDDFGKGYSSLALIKKLPIEYIKIDKSFVQEIAIEEEDDEAKAIVNAIIAMSHIIKLKIVAEGVETQEQLSLLRKMECDYIQGYFISRPVSADVFKENFLVKN